MARLTGLISTTLAVVALWLAIPALAEDEPADEQTSSTGGAMTSGLSRAEVEAALTAMDADAGLDDAAKALLRPKYQEAIKALKETAAFEARQLDYRDAIKSAPPREAELRTQLQALPSAEDAASVTPPASIEALQKAIDSQQAALSELNERLSKTASELARTQERPLEISARLPEIQRQLADVRVELAGPALAEDAASPSRVADRMLLQARESMLVSEAEMLNWEQLSQSPREQLVEAQHELLAREVENATAILGMFQTVSAERLLSEAERVGSLATSVPRDIAEGDQTAQALATEVQALATQFEQVVQNRQRVKAAQDELMSKLDRLTERYEGVKEELQVSVGGSGMAQILLDEMRRFHSQRAAAERLFGQLPSLEASRIAALEIRKQLRGQSEIERQFADHPSEAVAMLVTTRREVLGQLRVQYGHLTRALAVLEGDKKRYLDRAEEVRSYAAEQLFGFGMRSAPPIGLATITAIPDGLRWFFQAEHWAAVGHAAWRVAARTPVLSTAVVFLVIVLLLSRRRIAAALQRTGEKVRRISTDRYRYTLEALLWTALLAIPAPLLIGVTGWGLQQDSEATSWLQGIGDGLQLAASISLTLLLVAKACQPAGLGAYHFKWRAKPLARCRRDLRSFALVYIPALLITFSGLYEVDSGFLFSLGRVSFMLAHLWTALVFWRLLNPSDGVLASFMREQPNSLVARWRYLWFPLVLAYPLVLVVIAGLGYIFTAIQLSLVLLLTATYLIAGIFLYRLTRRWFRIKQRRLALAEKLEERRTRQEAAATAGQTDSTDLVSIEPEAEQELDLVTITEQTEHLLQLAFSLGVAIAILLAWSDRIPLIGTLDAIPIPLAGGLTLLVLLKSVLIVVVTYIAAVNLPGLLELAVLRATRIDAGTRNAIATLFQYAVIAIGLTLFFNVLNVDWAKLGWIAAALSVGIGFGLQEVVANFVCGLILLFERPIRVGDVVTVNNVTGTVTKIQIRSTTITNGDRQAFIVPNKSLITGSLLNWTLNAGLNRIIVRLAVASDTDTEKARRILLAVAADHPLILDNPAPMATFEEFGKGSLNLVLYAFLADLDSRSNTVTELHTEIKKRFAEAGISIP